MAITSIHLLLDALETRIATITPDVAPDMLFRPCGDSAPLDLQTFGDRYDGCRRYEVTPGLLAGFQAAQVQNWNGDLLMLSDTVEIAVRYEMASGDGALRHLKRMIASDQHLIIRAIHPLYEDYTSPIILHDIFPTGTVQVVEIDNSAESIARIIKIQFGLTTSLGDP